MTSDEVKELKTGELVRVRVQDPDLLVATPQAVPTLRTPRRTDSWEDNFSSFVLQGTLGTVLCVHVERIKHIVFSDEEWNWVLVLFAGPTLGWVPPDFIERVT